MILLTAVVFPTTKDLEAALSLVVERRGLTLRRERAVPGRSKVDLDYKRFSDGQDLFFTLGKAQSQSGVDDMRTGFAYGNAGPTTPEKSPSNTPLGDYSFVLNEGGAVIRAGADGFFVDVKILSELRGT